MRGGAASCLMQSACQYRLRGAQSATPLTATVLSARTRTSSSPGTALRRP
jgi:hypothetical protein